MFHALVEDGNIVFQSPIGKLFSTGTATVGYSLNSPEQAHAVCLILTQPLLNHGVVVVDNNHMCSSACICGSTKGDAVADDGLLRCIDCGMH